MNRMKEVAMTQTIWKYPLPVKGLNEVHCDVEGTPLSVGIQQGVPMLYIQTEKAPMRTSSRGVYVIGTGWDVPEGAVEFMGTVTDEGGFVWHVYVGEEI